jgi:hypothetical protein
VHNLHQEECFAPLEYAQSIFYDASYVKMPKLQLTVPLSHLLLDRYWIISNFNILKIVYYLDILDV